MDYYYSIIELREVECIDGKGNNELVTYIHIRPGSQVSRFHCTGSRSWVRAYSYLHIGPGFGGGGCGGCAQHTPLVPALPLSYSLQSSQQPHHPHTVRGAEFHGLQFKGEGQEALTHRGVWAAPPYVCVWLCAHLQQTWCYTII